MRYYEPAIRGIVTSGYDKLALDSALNKRRWEPNFEIESSECFDRKFLLIKSEYLPTSKPVQEKKSFVNPATFKIKPIFRFLENFQNILLSSK